MCGCGVQGPWSGQRRGSRTDWGRGSGVGWACSGRHAPLWPDPGSGKRGNLPGLDSQQVPNRPPLDSQNAPRVGNFADQLWVISVIAITSSSDVTIELGPGHSPENGVTLVVFPSTATPGQRQPEPPDRRRPRPSRRGSCRSSTWPWPVTGPRYASPNNADNRSPPTNGHPTSPHTGAHPAATPPPTTRV